jgi:hypothetical protein
VSGGRDGGDKNATIVDDDDVVDKYVLTEEGAMACHKR